MRPVIGVTPWKEQINASVSEGLNVWNLNAVEDAGGIPAAFHVSDNDEVIDGYLEMVDGIFFTGGGDVNPLIFGEEPVRELGTVECDRDEFEIKLYKRAAQKNIPMLGICRGMQLMNIAAGGTVYQDIYSQRQGTNSHSPKIAFNGDEYHSVLINKESGLYSILGANEIKTNSYHHQSVKDVAEGYTVSAFSKDGIIEGIESSVLDFAVGIQWHPEVMYRKYPIFCSIFKAFVSAAAEYHNKKNL